MTTSLIFHLFAIWRRKVEVSECLHLYNGVVKKHLFWQVQVIVFGFLFASVSFAQAPLGSWQTHFNYTNAQHLEASENLIFCASAQGLFSYNPSTNAIITFSKADGLAENNISAMKFVAASSNWPATLVLGYRSGNIDLLQFVDNQLEVVKNINTIAQSTAIGTSKTINDVAILDKNGLVIMATDFGVLVIDLKTQSLKETYRNLGPNGNLLKINALLVGQDIVLATSQGIFVASIKPEINLQYFGSWQQKALADQNITQLWSNTLSSPSSDFLAYSPNTQQVFKLTNYISQPSQKLLPSQTFINGLIVEKGKIEVLNMQQIYRNVLLENVKAIALQNDKIWLADAKNGLVGGGSTIGFKTFNPLATDTLYQNRKDSTLIDQNGFRWTRQPYFQGIQVFDNKTNRQVWLSSSNGLPSNNVRTMALDRDGAVWVGTDRGVAVFDNTNAAFGAISAYRPIINRGYLLANEIVTSIAVDGANRKWIGTQNGLFLFTKDAGQQIYFFDSNNSPLPSNIVNYITASPEGSIYVRTPNGMVSYRADATEPSLNLSEVKIFPNPVRPESSALVVIEGLVENCTVKIVNAAGRLVFDTIAKGGTATWNSQLVSAGIYFVLMSDTKGQETLVGKVAVVK